MLWAIGLSGGIDLQIPGFIGSVVQDQIEGVNNKEELPNYQPDPKRKLRSQK